MYFMKRAKLAEQSELERRILNAATGLFARFGYRGTKTRQIACEAQVNEVTIYRRYGSKHGLYCAVIESGLESIEVSEEILARLRSASTRVDAIGHGWKFIWEALEPKRELLRLIQFGALEMSPAMVPVLRSKVLEFTDLLAGHLQPHIGGDDLPFSSLRDMVLLVAAIVAFESSMERLLGEPITLLSCLQHPSESSMISA